MLGKSLKKFLTNECFITWKTYLIAIIKVCTLYENIKIFFNWFHEQIVGTKMIVTWVRTNESCMGNPYFSFRERHRQQDTNTSPCVLFRTVYPHSCVTAMFCLFPLDFPNLHWFWNKSMKIYNVLFVSYMYIYCKLLAALDRS